MSDDIKLDRTIRCVSIIIGMHWKKYVLPPHEKNHSKVWKERPDIIVRRRFPEGQVWKLLFARF